MVSLRSRNSLRLSAAARLLGGAAAWRREALIFRRGEITKKGEDKKLLSFGRIRAIQDER